MSPCYHCLYPDMGNVYLSCSQVGVMATLVWIIVSKQTMEAIKILVDFGSPIVKKLLVLDAMSMQW
jgi:molybdopterin/thiamine biosynthesis adenylyltransferase